jgi:hypothetical protein
MKKWILSFKYLLLALPLMLATSCGEQPKLPEIPGVKGPLFNVMDGKVMITVKLLNADLNFGAKAPIPKTKASYFEVSPNVEDGGTIVVFYMDVDDLKEVNIGLGDANTLPDGRPIPGIPGGEMRDSLRVDTELLDTSFYYNKKLFGFYIPLKWDTRGFGGYWNVVIKGKNIGMLSAVASDDSGNNAGMLVFLKLDALKDKQLQKLINLSEKNSHIMY